jgi:hypothetical protein
MAVTRNRGTALARTFLRPTVFQYVVGQTSTARWTVTTSPAATP